MQTLENIEQILISVILFAFITIMAAVIAPYVIKTIQVIYHIIKKDDWMDKNCI